MTRFDMRLALGTPWDRFDGTPLHDGRSALWVRMPDVDMSAAALAILGDYVPFGISQSQGRWMPSNSLDNTIRVQRLVPTEWVLCDVRIDGIHDGFGHGDGLPVVRGRHPAGHREPVCGAAQPPDLSRSRRLPAA